MKSFLQFIIITGYIQLLSAETVYTETISPELNPSEEQSQYDSDTHLPYGINLDKYTHENEDLPRHVKYIFAQKGKIVDVAKGHSIYDIYDADTVSTYLFEKLELLKSKRGKRAYEKEK